MLRPLRVCSRFLKPSAWLLGSWMSRTKCSLLSYPRVSSLEISSINVRRPITLVMISDARFSYITSHANYLGLYFVLASFVFANPAYSSILLPCLSRFSLYPVHIMKPEFAYEVKPTLLSLYKFLIDRYIPL